MAVTKVFLCVCDVYNHVCLLPYMCVTRFLHCEDHELGTRDVVVKHELVLRQWTDINTSHEFRCFVRHGRLIGQS